MRSSALQFREFPALLMTVLFIAASLSSTGCLRLMTQQAKTTQELARPILDYAAYETNYTSPSLENQFSSETSTAARLTIHR